MVFRLATAVTLSPLLGVTAIAEESDPAIPYQYASRGEASVPFVIPVEQSVYQAMVDELPTATIAMDKDEVLERLVQHFDQRRMKFGDADPADVAERIYTDVIEPHIKPRVEAFNNGLNATASEEQVSVGFLAFAGLANGMANNSPRPTVAKIIGEYRYEEGRFDDGQWEWSDPRTTGPNQRHRQFSVEIDETLEIDLEPFGLEESRSGTKSVRLSFRCRGVVKLEEKYSFAFLEQPDGPEQPQTVRRLRPYVDVTASKVISNVDLFNVPDERQHSVDNRVEHAAIMEVAITAEERDPVEN
ncbi:MAG: hypothetical protein WD534_16400 [Phycisphaeraceae bacterium]